MIKIVFISIFIILYFNIFCNGFGDITVKKCNAFSKFVYEITEESSLTLLPVKRLKNVSRCNILEVPLIVGGVEAKNKEFPHMAVIGYGKHKTDKIKWACGGSLISLLFILTAAHCIKSPEYGDAQKIRLGLTDLENPEKSMNEFFINKSYIHPKYDKIKQYHDIGLFKLSHFVKPNEYIRPACLNVKTNLNWKIATAIGFGKLDYSSSGMSNKLMKVNLNNIDNETCQNIYKSFIAMDKGVLPSQFCAGELKGGKDTCSGDSGGSLQRVLSKPYCMYQIIGITSFGIFCGFKKSPGIYTKVAYYIPWIEKIVWNNNE